MIFRIKIAGYVFQIVSLYESVYRLCQTYITEEPFSFEIVMTQSDIENERLLTFSSQKGICRYPDAWLEETAVYRKICDTLISYNTILFHSSAVAVDGYAYLFAAPSGVGKSTHVRFWEELFGDRAIIINDDKPCIAVRDRQAIVYGTPWSGKSDLNTNISCPIRSVCFLERGKENTICEIKKDMAFPKLLDQTYRPNGVEAYSQVLSTLSKFIQVADFYFLKCTATIEAAKTAYAYMKREG